MKQGLSEALDESLTLLEDGQATLEECLTRYPEYAGDLRPLLVVALEMRRVPVPTSSSTAFAAGKRRMLQALAERKRQRSASPSPLRRCAEWIASLLHRKERPAAWRRASAFRLALAATVVLVLFALAGTFLPSWFGMTVAQAATIGQVNGVVKVLPAGSSTWRPASAGERVEAGDRIRTGPSSATTLVFFDGSTTDLEAETEVAVIQMDSRRDDSGKVIVLHQRLGRTYSRVQRLPDLVSRFEIEAPTAAVAVRGTEFALTVEADGTTHVMVVEGVVNVTAQGITIAVLAGQETTVQPDQPPAPTHPVLVATPMSQPTPTSAPTDPLEPTETPESARTPEPPGQTITPQPPGLTKTPEPPGQTKTPQPPGQDKTPKPTETPEAAKTPQPPGLTKTPQPPGLTKTPQPPGQDKTPKP